MKLPALFSRAKGKLAKAGLRYKQASRAKFSRFVLSIGDEGAVLLQVVGGKVVSRLFSPSADARETRDFMELAQKSPKLPLILVFDTLDQTYVQQTLPPVTAMSVGRLMRKRLEREFSNDYLKGALLLGREKEKRRDWIFLMAALQNTGITSTWLNLVAEWPNRCKGIYLLPLEAAVTVRGLRAAKEAQAEGWQLLVSYNKISGVRQVVYKGGQLVLTRLGHPAYESNPEAVAGAIEQEIVGTREYIKRLMPQEGAGLAITILVAEDIRPHIDRTRLGVGEVSILTPYEASQQLGFADIVLPADRFADIVLAMSIGASSKHLLSLSAPLIVRQGRYYKGIRATRLLAAAAVIALVAWLAVSIGNVVVAGGAITTLEQRQQVEAAALQQSREKAANAKEDLEKIADVVELYERIGGQAFGPEPLLIRLAAVLGGKAHVQELTWDVPEKPAPAVNPAAPNPAAANPATPGATALPPAIEMHMKLELPVEPGTDIKKIQLLATDVINSIKVGLAEYDISNAPLPGVISENEQINVSLTQSGAEAPAAAPNVAPVLDLTIKGPVENKEAKTPPAPPPSPGGANGHP